MSHQGYSQQRPKSGENHKIDLSQVLCHKCNQMGHYINKCPLKIQQNNTVTQEKGYSANSREIILNKNSSDNIRVNLVQISNVGQKLELS